ncbi:FtsQ-type POTRA domain-containing protein [Patescibacteria group bacterium]|nr:FtsQ-type POTRA domain-containing protein [Patescibacteria group bacterium]
MKSRFFWGSVFIFVLGTVILYFLFFSSLFQVEKVIVTGNDKILKKDIQAVVRANLEKKIVLFSSRSIFLVNLQKIGEDILNDFLQIAEVEISRGLPDALNIIVVERLGVATWCQEDYCFLMDDEGVIFEVNPPDQTLLKIIDKRDRNLFTLRDKVIEKNRLERILEIQRKLTKELEIAIQEFIVFVERLNVKTLEGWEIYFDLTGDIKLALTKLSLLLEKEIPPEARESLEYIDLRFSKVYYK